MDKPATFKPWIDGRGQPVCIPDPDGHFVTLADYQALEQKLAAQPKGVEVVLEPAPTEKAADGADKS